jgi:hypothetical protein
MFLRLADKIVHDGVISSSFEKWWEQNECSATFTSITNMQMLNQVENTVSLC